MNTSRPLKKKILMVLQSDYPPDIRVEKEAKSLIQAGFAVYLVCNNKKRKPLYEEINGLKVFRMRHFSQLVGKLHRLVNAPVYFNPVWFFKIFNLAIKLRIDYLHVHDLPLALTTIHIGKILRLPTVLDLHENYPAIMREWNHFGIACLTYRNPRLAQLLESLCLRLTDKIIVIAQEHKSLLVSRKIPEHKISILENVPSLDLVNSSRQDKKRAKHSADTSLVYYGILGPERNLTLAIRALSWVVKEIPNVKLYIIGDGPELPKLRNYSKQHKMEAYIVFTGWLEFENVIPYLDRADIFVMPHKSNESLDNGVPNKLFQYMAFGKPTVVPNSKASARVVRETNCGEIFEPDSAEDFARAVIKVFNTKDFPYGKNGRDAILKKYNWENISKNLLTLYNSFNKKN